MSASSAGGRTAVGQTSELRVAPLEESSVVSALTCLRDVFLTSLGPRAHGILLHNDSGGHVSLTAASPRILDGLSVSKPLVKLVISTLRDHVRTHSDGGSLAAALSLQLILNALKLNLHRRLVAEIYDVLLRESVAYLSAENCPCKTSLDMTNTNMMLHLIRSLCSSRPTCLLYDTDLTHMCQLSLTTFLKTIPGDSDRLQSPGNSNLLYMTSPGRSVQDSEVLEGILYLTPQIPTYRCAPLFLRTTPDGFMSVALVEASMAGDSDAYMDVTYQTDVRLSDTTLDRLLEFSEALCRAGVGLVACQRVIHPTVKQRLRQRGVFCLDRLGSVYFKALRRLAGGQMLDPFAPGEVCPQSALRSVDHVVYRGKSYVHLRGAGDGGRATDARGRGVYTVCLCHRSEEAVTELKELFESIQHILSVTMTRPMVLAGATCWQTCVLSHLVSQTDCLAQQCVEGLGCSRLQFTQVLQSYIAAMSTVVKTIRTAGALCSRTGHHLTLDNQNKRKTKTCQCHETNATCHCFYVHVTCLCGAVTHKHSGDICCVDLNDMNGNNSFQRVKIQTKSVIDSEKQIDWSKCHVFDALTPMLGALKTAVAVSCTVLGIHSCVEDVN